MIRLDNIEEFQIPFEECPQKWLFLEEDKTETSQTHQDQIISLNREASKFLWDFEMKYAFFSAGIDLEKYFKSIEYWNSSSASEKDVKKWLYQRGIPFNHKVFFIPNSDCGFVLTWKMLIKYSSSIFFANDQTIWDSTLNWRLTFHHDEVFNFYKNRLYNSKEANLEWEKRQQEINNFLQTAELAKNQVKYFQNPFLK